jgi:hypothetical protein
VEIEVDGVHRVSNNSCTVPSFQRSSFVGKQALSRSTSHQSGSSGDIVEGIQSQHSPLLSVTIEPPNRPPSSEFETEDNVEDLRYLKQPLWWVGMVMMVAGKPSRQTPSMIIKYLLP